MNESINNNKRKGDEVKKENEEKKGKLNDHDRKNYSSQIDIKSEKGDNGIKKREEDRVRNEENNEWRETHTIKRNSSAKNRNTKENRYPTGNSSIRRNINKTNDNTGENRYPTNKYKNTRINETSRRNSDPNGPGSRRKVAAQRNQT